jgi:hypothetical protein
MNHGNVPAYVAKGLLALKSRIAAAKIPPSKIDESLNVATWNIREFGKKLRSDAAIHYIAEIIGQFDLVSLVELREDLTDLNRVLAILGPEWRVVYSGLAPDAGGNGERIGFIYDRRAATFNGFAASAIPPREKIGDEYLIVDNFWWRLPYMASFRSGNFDFIMLAAHIRWGASESSRIAELDLLADWIESFRRSEKAIDKDLLVVGDYNIPDRKGKLFQAIAKHGLRVPKALAQDAFGSNLAKNKRYDQILQYPSEIYRDSFADKGGILDFHIDNKHIPELFPPTQFKSMTAEKYTRQLSDHLPLWIQVRTDNDQAQLEQLVKG